MVDNGKITARKKRSLLWQWSQRIVVGWQRQLPDSTIWGIKKKKKITVFIPPLSQFKSGLYFSVMATWQRAFLQLQGHLDLQKTNWLHFASTRSNVTSAQNAVSVSVTFPRNSEEVLFSDRPLLNINNFQIFAKMENGKTLPHFECGNCRSEPDQKELQGFWQRCLRQEK